jgi:osmoprotectant transport system ATP-binding protein
MAASVEFRDVSVRDPRGAEILSGVSLTIQPGESVAFVGRSGAGKTTALKLVNGLVNPASGTVAVDATVLRSDDLPTLRRRIGYIIQGVGLFPHRTVMDNVATVPRLLGWEEGRIEREVRAILERVDLPFDKYAPRFPRTLSGGEQQRVGIARALVFEPSMLLCDEPFAALDPIVRSELQQVMVDLRRERGVTVIFVTHDVREAMLVAGRIVHFESGRVIADVPAADYPRSDQPLVRRFVESSAYVHA